MWYEATPGGFGPDMGRKFISNLPLLVVYGNFDTL